MSTLFTIKKKINSIKKISKIANTMKIIAISKINKAKNNFLLNSEFQKEFLNIIPHLINEEQNNDIPTNLYVVFTSTMGMAGAYNTNVLKLAVKNIAKTDKVIVFGDKGSKYFINKKNNNVIKHIEINDKTFEFFNIKYVSDMVARLFVNKKIGKVNVIYSKFIKNKIVPQVSEVLPFDKAAFEGYYEKTNFNFDTNKKHVLRDVINLYVESVIYACVLEAKLCEHISRKNAMTQASSNIDDTIYDLKNIYNKKRREKITQELAR
ncbi:MAG: F0F1 ATP synthase subunit gamma [Mycoplasmataceae bacterium]|jgi:F-type H+-transporting ATPase subunit gamma|nr:F0F1 ATP synthase subunit gamma [Mycoplasmataceae bacterium]